MLWFEPIRFSPSFFIGHRQGGIDPKSGPPGPDLPAILDGQFHDFLHFFSDHDFVTTHEGDQGIGRGFDIANLLGVNHQVSAIKSCHRNHVSVRPTSLWTKGPPGEAWIHQMASRQQNKHPCREARGFLQQVTGGSLSRQTARAGSALSRPRTHPYPYPYPFENVLFSYSDLWSHAGVARVY